MTVDTGVTLGGRYLLAERIATGGMGEVWRATDDLLHRDVAVKVLKSEYAEDTGFRDRFRAEARHTAALSHPGIASVFDYGEDGDTAYLVMELVPGEPLSAILAREGRLSAERTLDLVAQSARALDEAHRAGVIHRDVKPGNILVCPDGTAKLTDFGIARAASGVPLTRTGVVLGTAQYVSPEQAYGREVTAASDVYSLGVVAYECLAGRPPFQADTPVGVAMAHVHDAPEPLPDDVPAAAADVVTKALAKEPADRYASAADLAVAADAARAPATTTMSPPTLMLPAIEEPVVGEPFAEAPVVEGPRRPSRQALLVAGAVVLAVLLGLLVGAANRTPPKRTVPPLVGKPAVTAYATLDRLGLKHTVKSRYDRHAPAGTVVSLAPGAGRAVRKGDNVSVTVSLGPQPVTLPDGLTGQPVMDVTATLTGLGLVVDTTGEASDVQFGTVTAVAPTTGLHQGDTVTVTYSLGRPSDGKRHGKDH